MISRLVKRESKACDRESGKTQAQSAPSELQRESGDSVEGSNGWPIHIPRAEGTLLPRFLS
jgi:hypothetical protein